MFRFTIRDVLWLTALVAVAVGWWIDHATQASSTRFYSAAFDSAATKLSDLGYSVGIGSDGKVRIQNTVTVHWPPPPQAAPTAPDSGASGGDRRY